MERLYVGSLFGEPHFLQKLAMSHGDLSRRIEGSGWDEALAALLPVRERLSCVRVLTALAPQLEAIAPSPAEGWPAYTYQVAVSLLYSQPDRNHTAAQRDAALCALQCLQALLDREREALPFDPWLDFAFCTEAEIAGSGVAG